MILEIPDETRPTAVEKYEFTLPRSFRPTDFLPLRLAMRADDANWLVSIKVALSRGPGLRE